MSILDDVLAPSPSLLGPRGVGGTVAYQGEPKPKKAPQKPAVPMQAKSAPPVDLSDNPFAPGAPDLSDNPFGSADPNAALHAEFQRGDLGRKNAVLNRNDVGRANDEMAQDEATTRGKVLGTMAAPLSEVPGGGLIQRAISGDATKDAIASSPALARIPAKMIGGVAGAGVLPGGIIGQGAGFGALSGLLQDSPAGVGKRLKDAAIQGGVGAATGAVAGQLLGPSARAQKMQLLTNRAKSAAKLYGQAEQEGAQNAVTPQVEAFLASEDIAPIVEQIQSGPTGRNLSTGALLKAVDEHLSDQSLSLKGKLGRLTPMFQNKGRRAASDIGALKGQLYGAAADTPYSDAGGFMPSLKAADTDYARNSGLLDSFDRGYNALSSSERSALPNNAKNILRPDKSGAGFSDWAAGKISDTGSLAKNAPSQDELRTAAEGVLSRLRGTASLLHPIRTGAAFKNAVPMLASTGQLRPLLNSTIADPTAFQKLLQLLSVDAVTPER